MVYRFGDYELEPARYELRRAGTRVALEPRVVEVLAYLLGQRERVVSKDELLARVWPGQEASEASLTRAIHAARRALGGARDGWIRTVYGRGFVFTGPAQARPATNGGAVPSSSTPRRLVPSVAVLPFADLSAARDQAYFCDGLVQELIDALGHVDGLTVSSRTSSALFGGAATDVRTIGERLNVSAVLEGSVRKDGGRLRVSVQLVDTADNYRLWSATFDRRVADIFAVQEEIATSVARTLQGVVTREARRVLGAVARTDVDAYDCYLRARQLCGRPSGARLEAARQLYRRAIEIDPAYAPGWAGLADCDAFLYFYWGAPPADLARAEQASRRAVKLGPDIAESHAARAAVLGILGERDDADEAFRTAIRLRPRLAKTYYQYGRFCFMAGRLSDAARAYERALALSPDEAHLGFVLAKVYARLERADDARVARERAIVAAERQLAVDPDDVRTLYFGAGALVTLGEATRGLEWADRAVSLSPDDPVTAVFAAAAYAGARRVDEALRLLTRGLDDGFRNVAWLAADPDFERLRRHPRVATVIARASRRARPRRLTPAARPRASA